MAGGKIRKEKPKAPSNHYQGGISFHKSKGQHILKNPLLVDSIVQKAGIKSTDVILEIGQGTGNLTKKLLEAGKEVIAVELDSRMVLELQRRFQGISLFYPLEDIISSHVQASLPPNKLQVRCDHVPERVRHETRCPIWRQPLLPLISQHSALCQSLPLGKNNFRPPPKIDSSVVRIEPRKPQPQVNKKEWDGFLRVCFIRKNKTLGSIFRQKSVLLMLEKNFKTLQAVLASVNGSTGEAAAMDLGDQSMGMEDDDNEMDDDDDVEMDEGQGGEFKEKVMNVLKEGGFEEKRSSKLSQQEFLDLLSLFNKSGIHFS